MCGLVGIITTRPDERSRLEAIVTRMSDCIVHRGPDDSGAWSRADAGVAFGFRRLSIIDLSPLGHQPMQSASGRFVMVFNGEVYNYRDLRAELLQLGHSFRGGSDSEVMLAAFEQWGVPDAVKRFLGMFAIAIWDDRTREVHLVRDRLGKKPVFIHAGAGRVTFASELKSLFAAGISSNEIDSAGLQMYLRYLYVPAPLSILSKVRKLMPGTIATFSAADPDTVRETTYWSLADVAKRGQARASRRDEQVLDEFVELLSDAVNIRMFADVPLGALLSGGIDSSLVTAVMQSQSSQPVKTFCIGFDEDVHDERAFARDVAAHLGTQHHEMQVSGADALALVPRLSELVDEPLANPSVLPTFLVCQLARRHVTVVLTGDGGDELFAGYNRQSMALRLHRADFVPTPMRRVMASLLGMTGAASARFADRALALVDRSPSRPAVTAERLTKLARALGASDAAERYRVLLSAWTDPGLALKAPGDDAGDPVMAAINAWPQASLLDRLLLADQACYLPDDLLAKVDRTSMAASLEARVPLLDHRVVEFSWGLEPHFKLRNGASKYLLRQALTRFVPRELFERPKTGFTVPLASWLRGPLREWAEDLLSDRVIAREGTFQGGVISKPGGRCLVAGTNSRCPSGPFFSFRRGGAIGKV